MNSMKYSQLFGKTNKTAKEYDSKNATLLQKAGFIDQVMSGVYTYLPLGNRVLAKIEKIVREEMDKIGNEIFMPAIVPTDLWEQTDRLDSVDVLFKAVGANKASKLRNDAEYVLNSTHEEVVTPLAKKFSFSYKDFPFAVYQIQSKFRNEPRAKSGLMRGREFRMKDLYSFHTSEDDLLDYYFNVATPAYEKVYKRLGIGEDTVIALASGGDFTKEYSHEFQTLCETGEDTLFYVKSKDVYYNQEVAPSKAPIIEQDQEEKEIQDVFGEGVVSMEKLVKFLDIPAYKCVKTLIYKADEKVIVAAVRGDYEINEIKLKEILNCKHLELADKETVKKITGAEIGYAGIINLPDDIDIYIDDSIEPMKNFECGTNKTNFHTININWGRDIDKPDKFYDFKLAKEGDLYPETDEEYKIYTAAEVGNIFPLNTKFSDSFEYTFTDENGDEQPVYMGCYGIGTSRIMGVIAEKSNDENGLIWPTQIAPYHVHLMHIGEDDQIIKITEKLYKELHESKIEVLWDDRDTQAGEKFADADLIGIPVRLVISKRSLEKGGVEMKLRSETEADIVKMDDILKHVQNCL
ncbi:proline--tRNA ligase [Candidatus Dojkabacteria bacterium]|nr:proline--tRNA ligase [Candidatus Dojkabacteria bacterium]